ncbi:hypothetical protein [Rhizobium binxianense]|uniref:hypothetical protein n=1 Tax=Rhizobium binxianense TaxID=3024242 RepID=UPI00234F5BED|nr:hypothetical protein [Rhizobium sp. BC56]MDC7741217.1 hypothetical protein [Rhizobium sp. BC56]
MTAALFRITACIEGLTGIALILVPDTVARLLLGAALPGPGLAVARLTGIALLALAVMAWVGREASGRSPALAAVLTYNLLAAIYLAGLVVEGAFVGNLLLPATLLHGVLGVLLVRAWFRAGKDG